jgi:hypothetical protein
MSTIPTTNTLTSPVGPGQANTPEDMRLVRRYLNAFIARGYLVPFAPVAEEGSWDSQVAAALQAVEDRYFYGEADPNNKIENGDTLFNFLTQAESATLNLGRTLSGEVYTLASLMVPGGVDYYKRTTVKEKSVVNGKTVETKTIHKELVNGNIRTYLPDIMLALTRRGLNNTDMLMMALGTIRAETSSFRPIDEGVSTYNTTPVGTPGRFLFDKYERGTGPGDRVRNTEPGDGALFKGRGFVQLTGRYNYTNIGKQIGVDLVANPDLANDPVVAAATLAQYLKNVEREVVKFLAVDNLRGARRSVNGGSHGLKEFEDAFAAGRKYLGITLLPKAKSTAKAATKGRHKSSNPIKKK